ncbi:hypothetical protein [Scytonema millei]|uniref:Uncharacterized protein n=1 Tax=Scytonema millei VB511283 TaxID=1245923 RepID=A0A9X5E5F2_9CYAN|nr:hypothetical protein [Scytonema millei]NHC35499.1 hypothetical protein [Scytonema millei VB511283]
MKYRICRGAQLCAPTNVLRLYCDRLRTTIVQRSQSVCLLPQKKTDMMPVLSVIENKQNACPTQK